MAGPSAIIAAVPKASSDLVTKVTEGTDVFARIDAGISELMNMSSTPPTFQSGTTKINIPTIHFPTITSPLSPFDVSWPSIKCDIDGCHLDLGFLGSIMKMMMFAVTTLIDAILSGIAAAINQAIVMFMTIVDYTSSIYTWLETNVITPIWAEIKRVYTETWKNFDQSKKDLKTAVSEGATEDAKNKAKTKNVLYKRALDWLEKLIGTLSGLIQKVKDAVTDLIDWLDTVRKDVYQILKDVMDAMLKLPADVICMIKATTAVMAL